MPSRNAPTQAQPTFVFMGTIKKLKSATMDAVPINDRTAIVTVEQIIQAPPDLSAFLGQDITVELRNAKARTGQQMIFYTIGWIYGTSVAVRAIRQEPAKAGGPPPRHDLAEAANENTQPSQANHFEDADMAIVGKVLAVRVPAETALAKVSGGVEQSLPITEHDPDWREAVIQVDEVLKGNQKQKQVIVRFPASSDVMWHGSPKFEAGQQGYFILHKPKAPEARVNVARKQKPKGAATQRQNKSPADFYLALDSQDFQPLGKQSKLTKLLQSPPQKKKRQPRNKPRIAKMR